MSRHCRQPLGADDLTRTKLVLYSIASSMPRRSLQKAKAIFG